MIAFLRFELRRVARDPRLFLFTVLMPVVSYVVFTGVGDNRGQAEGVPVPTMLLVGLAAYGAVIGVLSIGVGVSVERTQGWLRQLRLTPLPASRVVAVKAFLATLTSIPPVLGVGLAGYLEHGVSLPASRWVGMVLAMWLGTVPFALLGLALGYGVKPQIAQPVSFLLFFILSAIGGLLVPTVAFPGWLRDLAGFLPTNRYGELGWAAAAGRLPSLSGTAILLAWTSAFGLLAALAYRRSAASR